MNWFRKLFHRYDDYKECGTWSSFNTETGEVIDDGIMYSRTIKIEHEDGTIGLDSEWITDGDMEQEMNGGPQTGPADLNI